MCPEAARSAVLSTVEASARLSMQSHGRCAEQDSSLQIDRSAQRRGHSRWSPRYTQMNSHTPTAPEATFAKRAGCRLPPEDSHSSQSRYIIILQRVHIDHDVSLVEIALQRGQVGIKARPRARTSWETVRVHCLGLLAFSSALRPAQSSSQQNEHHSAEWFMWLRSRRAAVLRSSCSQYAVGLLVSAGDYQVQHYQPPLWRGHVLCVILRNVCRMNAVLLMLLCTQAATRHSKMRVACVRTSGTMIPTASASPLLLLLLPLASDAASSSELAFIQTPLLGVY